MTSDRVAQNPNRPAGTAWDNPGMRKNRHLRIALLLLLMRSAAFAAPGPSPEGRQLQEFLDSLHVEDLWLAGTHVNWRTGKPDAGPKSGSGTKSHCSAFAAAACERLGVYILRPPDHGQELLANAQSEWLGGPGREAGWVPVRDGRDAQKRANRGEIVVASYRSANPHRAGHIAIVRPGDKSDARIDREGPDVIQAGQSNYASTSLQNAFHHHRGAWESGDIRFYAHARGPG